MIFQNNRPLILILLLIGCIFTQSSCSRYYYQPNSVNAPMLNEKGDLKLGIAGTSNKDNLDGNFTKSSVMNFQAAYSPMKYLGVMANFSNYKHNINVEDKAEGDVDAHATLFEVGAGGYYPIFLRKNGFGMVADNYIGFGGGKLNSDVRMNFNRLFIQPGIHLTHPFFDIGFSTRIAGIKYNDFNSNGMSAEYIQSQGLTNITDKRHYFIEPALTLRVGYKYAKFEMQLISSSSSNNLEWDYDGNIVTLGVHFSLEHAFR